MGFPRAPSPLEDSDAIEEIIFSLPSLHCIRWRNVPNPGHPFRTKPSTCPRELQSAARPIGLAEGAPSPNHTYLAGVRQMPIDIMIVALVVETMVSSLSTTPRLSPARVLVAGSRFGSKPGHQTLAITYQNMGIWAPNLGTEKKNLKVL